MSAIRRISRDSPNRRAPRLRGQPLAATYTVPAGATLRSVAADFQAPLSLLVAELAGYDFLLSPGFEVPGQGGKPVYIVASGDTLGSVAARFAVTAAQLGGALAETVGLLQPGAAVNLVRRTYPLAADDTLFTVISYLALDVATDAAQASAVDNFAAMNATLPDLFTAGTALKVPPPVTIAPGDTIASLAAAHGLTPPQVTTSIAARADVLAAGVAVTLESTSITVRSGQSLDEIAATAGLSLAAVSSTVQDLPGLLVPGMIIALPGTEVSYVVRSGDTLTTIAATLGATPSWIATTQLHAAQALRAGTVVAFLSRVAGFSLSDASISLVSSAANSLTFLFRTASNTAFSNLSLQLSYQVNLLEYGISDVPWASGYQSSQWLTFLLPPPGAAIGTVDVPIPLRAHPVPPSVTSQRTVPVTASHQVGPADTIARVARVVGARTAVTASGLLRPGAVLEVPGPAGPVTHQVGLGESLTAVADRHGVDAGPRLAVNAHQPGLVAVGARVGGADGSPTPQELRRYHYDYAFSTQRAAQDNVSTSQLQNTVLADGTPVSPQPDGLATALAQYAAVRDGLEQDLALLTRVNAGTAAGSTAAGQALQVFTELAGQVAQAWAARVSAGTSPAPVPSLVVGAVPRHAPRYQVRRGVLATGEPTVHLRPDGSAAEVHAEDLVVGLRGHVPAGGSGQAGRGPVAFTRVTGAPADPGVPTPGADEFDVLVPDRDVVTTQNIWGEVSVTRNANLVAGRPTNPAFVYAVPDVKAATPAVPLISWTDPFDLSAVPFDPAAAVVAARPLAGWLVNFFDALLNRYAVVDGDTLAKIAMRYDLTLASLAPALADVPGLLVVGAQLPLPSGNHQVASGDTLASVAAANSVQVADLVQAAADASGLLAPGRAGPACGGLAQPAGSRRLQLLARHGRHRHVRAAERDRLPAAGAAVSHVLVRPGDGPAARVGVLRVAGPAAGRMGGRPRAAGRRRPVGPRRQPVHDAARRGRGTAGPRLRRCWR